mgnify:CR=1 FL=1
MKKKMDGVYVIEDKMFNLKWASGLVSSLIPREWNDEEQNVVEKVFGKEFVDSHNSMMRLLNRKQIENKTLLGMDIDEYLNDEGYVITDPYFKAKLERASFENKFFGDKPVKFTKENADIIKEYVKGKKK